MYRRSNRVEINGIELEAPTVRGLLKSIAASLFSSIRQNKLAAVLAAVAFVVSTFLAISMQYDERPQYRQSILPKIERAEADFVRYLEQADRATDERWRLQYFLVAHGKAKAVLRIARDDRPTSPRAIEAHEELIRYYELVNEHMAIIRTEMSINQKLDYLSEWKKQQAALQRIRQRWLAWLEN
jgi:hypothetical protein